MTNVVRRSTVKSQRLLAQTRRLAAWMKANGGSSGDVAATPETDDDTPSATAGEAIADRGNPLD